MFGFFYADKERKILGSLLLRCLMLKDLLLDLHSRFAQTAIARAEQPGINPTIMLDGPNTIGGQAQRDRFAQDF